MTPEHRSARRVAVTLAVLSLCSAVAVLLLDSDPRAPAPSAPDEEAEIDGIETGSAPANREPAPRSEDRSESDQGSKDATDTDGESVELSAIERARQYFGGDIGPLTSEGVEFARLYFEPAVENARRRLDRERPADEDPSDPEVLEDDAAALVQFELWRAMLNAVDRGHYVVVPERKTRAIPNWDGVVCQQFSVRQDGVFHDVRFVLTREEHPALFSALEHRQGVERHLREELAREFNAQDFEERRAQFERYQRLSDSDDPSDQAAAFRMVPIHCRIDRETMLMIVR